MSFDFMGRWLPHMVRASDNTRTRSPTLNTYNKQQQQAIIAILIEWILLIHYPVVGSGLCLKTHQNVLDIIPCIIVSQ